MTDEHKNTYAGQLPEIPEQEEQTDLPFTISREQVCSVVQDLLPLYSEGLESKETKQFIEEHLTDCPECQRSLELLREPLPGKIQDEAKMEDALRKVRRKFKWNKTLVIILSLICLLFAGIGGWMTLKNMQIPGSDLKLVLKNEENGQTEAMIIYYGGPLLYVQAAEKEKGFYDIRAYGWSTDSSDHNSVKELTLRNPVDEIRVNGYLMYQDGVMISPRCLELFQNANGYAGSTYQMSLSRPDLLSMSFHMEADTEDPDSCIWTWVSDESESRKPDSDLLSLYKANAMVIMALTPNLSKIQLVSSDYQPYLIITRDDLNKVLESRDLTTDIRTPADLQKIINTFPVLVG